METDSLVSKLQIYKQSNYYLIDSTSFTFPGFQHFLGQNTRIRPLFPGLFLSRFFTRLRWVMDMFELTRMITRTAHDFCQISNGHFVTTVFCWIRRQIWYRCHLGTFLKKEVNVITLKNWLALIPLVFKAYIISFR